MSNHKRTTDVIELLEGGSEDESMRDSITRQHTTLAPVVVLNDTSVGKTGTLASVDIEAGKAKDGKDKETAKEAAPDTTDETVPARPAASTEEAAPTDDAEKPHILIVEDTQELAEVIQATLESAGMEVEATSRGAQGLEKVKAHVPDVLLLDIGLPDMTGWKMLEELHAWKEKGTDMPKVIVITAYGDPANRLIGKLQGIHSYLIKPFTSDEVEKVVRNALNATA